MGAWARTTFSWVTLSCQPLTEKDPLYAEIDYYGRVTGDWEKEYSSVLRLLEIFPRDVLAHSKLKAAFVHLGEPDRAAAKQFGS